MEVVLATYYRGEQHNVDTERLDTNKRLSPNSAQAMRMNKKQGVGEEEKRKTG
jgi:hypothetical protein